MTSTQCPLCGQFRELSCLVMQGPYAGRSYCGGCYDAIYNASKHFAPTERDRRFAEADARRAGAEEPRVIVLSECAAVLLPRRQHCPCGAELFRLADSYCGECLLAADVAVNAVCAKPHARQRPESAVDAVSTHPWESWSSPSWES